MGNSVSGFDNSNNSSEKDGNLQIKVVSFEDGEMVEMNGNVISVAEIMLQFPGHFVSDFTELAMAGAENLTSLCNRTRVAAMAADAETKPGGYYVLFKMQKLHSRVPTVQLRQVLTSTTGQHRVQLSPAVHGDDDVEEIDNGKFGQKSMKKLTKKVKRTRGHHWRNIRGTLRWEAKVTPLLPAQQQEGAYHATNQLGCINSTKISDNSNSDGPFHTSMQHRLNWTPKLETISEL